MAIEFKRAVLFESRQLLVELQLIWSVHNSITLLLPPQLIRELPCIRINLQGPLLHHIASSINSMGSVYHHNTINRYTAMTFIERLISCAASEMNCADNFQLLSNRRSPFGKFHLITAP